MLRLMTLALAFGLSATLALAQDNTERELEKFRAMLKSDPFSNPGLLIVDEGEALWKKPQGKKNVSLETCDLGKGPGVLAGAYAELPRYFADTNRVMDLETRLLHCMATIQDRDLEPVLKTRFSRFPSTKSELEMLSAYVANQSTGFKFNLKLSHPAEQEAYAIGETMFWRRQGPMDFSCATCHASTGQRIRLQNLANFDDHSNAVEVLGTWPAFRISHNTLRTMQHRMWDCFWQMRIDDIAYTSDMSIALITYLTKKADGGEIQSPGLKR